MKPQWFRLDHAAPALYILVAAFGCGAQRPGPLVPAGSAPVPREDVLAWVAKTTPTGSQRYRFKWLLREERSSAGGSGSARIAGPDSLRFDVAGPFGSGRASAAVVGDSALWTRPPDAIEKLVPSYPLMWALLGVARAPDAGAALRGLTTGHTTAWQYGLGADTVDYVLVDGGSEKPGKLSAEVRQAGKVIGRAVTVLSPEGIPTSARLTVPSVPARLDLTFTSTTPTTAFAWDIWVPSEP